MQHLQQHHVAYQSPVKLKKKSHFQGVEAPLPGSLFTERTLLTGIVLICLAFVVNVYDGTFLKPLLLYASCGLLLSLTLFQAIRRREFPLSWSKEHLFFVFYLAAGSLSLIGAANPRLWGEAMLQQCCYVTIFIIAYDNVRVKQFIGMILLLTAAVSFIALAHLLLPEGSLAYDFAKQFEHVSTFGNQSYFAGFLVLVIPLIIAEVYSRRESGTGVAPYALLLIVTLSLLVLSDSRSAWAALVISMCYVILSFGKKWNYMLAGFAALACSLIAMYFVFRPVIEPRLYQLFEFGPQSSVMRRVFFYEGAWNAFLSSPLIGRGLGNFIVFLPRFRSPQYWMFRSEDIVPHAHNEYLEILSETGVAGLACFALLVGFALLKLIRAQRSSDGESRILMAAFVASLIGVLFDALWSMNLRTIPVATCFWTLLAVALPSVKQRAPLPDAKIPKRGAEIAVTGAALAAGCVYGFFIIWGIGVQRFATEAHYLQAILLQTSSRFDDASLQFEEALKSNPHDPESRFYLATNLARRGEYANASKQLDLLLTDSPNYPKAGTLSAVCALELGDTIRSLAEIRRELAVNRSPQTLYYASLIARRLSHPTTESAYLAEILTLNITSGLKDFGVQSLDRLPDLPTRATGIDSLIAAYKVNFRDDSTLVRAANRALDRMNTSAR